PPLSRISDIRPLGLPRLAPRSEILDISENSFVFSINSDEEWDAPAFSTAESGCASRVATCSAPTTQTPSGRIRRALMILGGDGLLPKLLRLNRTRDN